MSAIHHQHNSLPPSLPAPWSYQAAPRTDQPIALPDESGRIIFTRQLWQRTMPDGNGSEHAVSNKSLSEDSHQTGEADNNSAAPSSRRASSNVSTRSKQRRSSHSPSRDSKTPLTPEESPPFRSTRKRTVGIVEIEDKELESAGETPAHSRGSSGDSTVHVCICQPDPKIPRPRNAFILYRQHHQAQVVAQHPGLANPEISKIIGEQWQNQPTDVKNKWKALAEEEKLRHQQQYPTYRYQPKRNGRRGSLSSDANGERPRCNKCGGRSILAPSTPFSHSQSDGTSPNNTVPQTPASTITPISRTLPVFRDLSLQSPAQRRMGRVYQPSNMSANHSSYDEDRDDIGPLSPDIKRRKYNGDHVAPSGRVVPARYGPPPAGVQVATPGTPFPFGQAPPPHPYPPAIAHVRRESLPGIRGVVSPPGPMPPPPRPGIGYQQHRLSQGHVAPDRSLQLPPLQTGSMSGPSGNVAAAGPTKTAEEQIMSMAFRYKVKVLRDLAPPAPLRDTPRGPLIAVEGDSADAVVELARWLSDELKKGGDLAVTVFDSPDVTINDSQQKAMVQYHQLAADWLLKSDSMVDAISYKPAVTSAHAAMADVGPANERTMSVAESNVPERSGTADQQTSQDHSPEQATSAHASGDDEKMEMDKTPTAKHPTPAPDSGIESLPRQSKPLGIVANYSLHASNVFACRIRIGTHDPYSPSDHWQWTATQWRGIVGPDLTIYVRDAVVGETGKPTVEISEEGSLFVLKRNKVDGEGTFELEPSALRRLGFEVGEWVRAFGTSKRGSA